MSKNSLYKHTILSDRNSLEPFDNVNISGSTQYWRWGEDNLFPCALSHIGRNSTAHRRIINDKANYIAGKGFVCDQDNRALQEFVNKVNGQGESLRKILHRIALDKSLFGNAFLEVAIDRDHSILALFHHDATTCRLSKDGASVILNPKWSAYNPVNSRYVAKYPNFCLREDGTLRSVIHYKDYEPMFGNYGIPSYIAGLNVSAIAYKTDQWNIHRLDNSFQLSGVMILDGTMNNEVEAEHLMRTAQNKFGGKPGQVMFMVKDCGDSENSRFIPISSSNEGDWKALHEQATTDIVVAHSWYRSLSGIDYGTGFNAERIFHEYEVALNTVIIPAQEEIMEPLRNIISLVFNTETTSLQIVNNPPAQTKPAYMKIWEARKADGLDYDLDDPHQQQYLAQLESKI